MSYHGDKRLGQKEIHNMRKAASEMHALRITCSSCGRKDHTGLIDRLCTKCFCAKK